MFLSVSTGRFFTSSHHILNMLNIFQRFGNECWPNVPVCFRKEFAELMEKYGSNPVAASGRISPTQLSTGETRTNMDPSGLWAQPNKHKTFFTMSTCPSSAVFFSLHRFPERHPARFMFYFHLHSSSFLHLSGFLLLHPVKLVDTASSSSSSRSESPQLLSPKEGVSAYGPAPPYTVHTPTLAFRWDKHTHWDGRLQGSWQTYHCLVFIPVVEEEEEG